MKNCNEIIEGNLFFLVDELRQQSHVASYFHSEMQSFDEQLAQIDEYLTIAGEYGLSYENIVSLLSTFPFKLSGHAAVKLLEVGLLVGFKTEMPEDAIFDRRM